jgi:rod shape-determining protein MreD
MKNNPSAYESASQSPSHLLGLLGNAQPERLVRPARGLMIWGTLVLVWLVSMLPWRQWPAAPDAMGLVIAFWCAHEHRRVGMVTAFVFGLLLDVHDSAMLGSRALTYVLMAYGAVALYRRLQRFDLWRQAVHMLPVFLLAPLPTQLIQSWLSGRWTGWDWAVSALITAALWPAVGWVLQLPQRRLDDVESSAV